MKIISGAQTGVDIAALDVAKLLGMETGGWMPAGWRTLDGARPEYEKKYGMKATFVPGYKVRTWLNVEVSDATLRLAADFTSPGERCTFNAIVHFDKPTMGVVWIPGEGFDSHASYVVNWLREVKPKVLNVAGNSEHTAPGIYRAAYNYLARVFLALE